MSRTRFIQVHDNLDTKWHEKPELPKPYLEIVVELGNGRYIDGYLTDENMFDPFDKREVDGLDKVRAKRWRYGMIDRPIKSYE